MSQTKPSPGLLAYVATPLNLVLFSVLAVTVYLRFRPKPVEKLPPPPKPIVFRTFTPPTLLPFNGQNGAPVYLAVRGRVFDVTPGRNFYGPDGPYANFAGRDASRGLANHSFDEDMLTKDLNGPLDSLSDLSQEEVFALEDWEAKFNSKYNVIGKLVAVGSEETKASASPSTKS